MATDAPKLSDPRIPFGRAIQRAAALGLNVLVKHAFPSDGTPAKGIDGKAAPKLNPAYAKRKIKRGRPGVPDARFTSKTAQAFGVVAERGTRGNSPTAEVKLGFRARRGVAEGLQKRNKYMGHTRAELQRIYALAERELRSRAAGVRIVNGTIHVDVSPRPPGR